MKKIYKVIVLILFALVLLIPATAFGQMSLGTIQNAVESDESRDCEYTSLENAQTPLRFFVQFPTTPDVTPIIHGEHPNSQFSSDFGNDFLNFSTNSTDLFTITLNLGYEFEDTLPRNFFYELITKDGENRQVGSWQITDTNTCKVFELNARPPVHILTEQEIIDNIAEWEQEQHAETQRLQTVTNDLITIIVIVVVSVGFVFFIIIVFMRLSKSKDSANAIYVTQQFSKAVEKTQETTKFLKQSDEYRDIKVDYIITEIKKALNDVMHGINLHTKIVKKSPVKPKITKISKEIEEEENKAMGSMSKAFDVVKGALIETKPKKNLGTEYEKYNKLATSEITEKLQTMYNQISKYHTDEDFRTEYGLLQKIYKERNETK